VSEDSTAEPTSVLEGHLSVEATLEAGVRPIHRIVAVRPGDRRLGRLRALARERGVVIEPRSEEEVAALASGRTHGGVVALVGPRRHLSIHELLSASGPTPFVVMLDGIEDPYNFGAAVRALYAAGVDGLVVRERSWESASGVVARASAGAAELMPTATVASAEAAADVSRQHGLRVLCAATGPEATSMFGVDLRGPSFVLIGGERRGITRSFLAAADLLVAIPYGRLAAPPLGTATAAALIAFEALRQRSASGATPPACGSRGSPRRGSDAPARGHDAAPDRRR
jgi:23S rRNA (guanosine2251-2'-O)-methyltransferase